MSGTYLGFAAAAWSAVPPMLPLLDALASQGCMSSSRIVARCLGSLCSILEAGQGGVGGKGGGPAG